MYNPLKYYTQEALKNMNDKAKEILSFMYPPITMYEEGGEVKIEADLPGFNKKDIKIRTNKNSVTIEATRKIQTEGTVIVNQRPEHVFKRVSVPYEIEQNADLVAKYADGVLKISLQIKGMKTVKVE